MGLPALPDVNCLPRGAHTTYAHKWPQMYAEKGAAVDPLRDDRSRDGARRRGAASARGARVTASVLGPGVVVGAGCVVEGSYLMANVTLGENVKVEASMVCDGAVVHAGAVVGKGAVLSHDVVVGAGHGRPRHARLSLAEQPEANDDEYDSDEDGLEVGSFPNERRVSMTRDASGGSLGAGSAAGGRRRRRRGGAESREARGDGTRTPRASQTRRRRRRRRRARVARGRRGRGRRGTRVGAEVGRGGVAIQRRPRAGGRGEGCVRCRRRVGL